MANAPEPLLDLSEIVDLYKDDARRMVQDMRNAIQHWDEFRGGGTPRSELRRLSHQLRGSGRTYGFRNVTRISKAMEQIVVKLDRKQLAADDRVKKSLIGKIDRLASI